MGAGCTSSRREQRRRFDPRSCWTFARKLKRRRQTSCGKLWLEGAAACG
jgi:hypothetical protein